MGDCRCAIIESNGNTKSSRFTLGAFSSDIIPWEAPLSPTIALMNGLLCFSPDLYGTVLVHQTSYRSG